MFLKIRLPGFIAIGMLTLVIAQAKSPEPGDVTVYLRDAVVSTPGAIERAKWLARNMFASIGVNLQFRSPGSEHPAGLVVEVLLTGGSSEVDDSGPLAEAYPFAGATGHVTVLYDRVRASAGVSRDLEPLLLAHAMVHELTHVLQCLDRHAETGVMKAHWNSDDYFEMRWKPLAFTPEDVALIRLGMQTLHARGEHEHPRQP